METDPYAFYPTEDELQAKKKEYAAALIRDPWHRGVAARLVEPRETHIAFILSNWQFDNDVNRYMQELQAEKKTEAIIPTKEEFAAAVYRDALTCKTSDMKLDYYKLFASLMGYVEKPGSATNNTTNNIQQNVLVLPAKETGKEYEDKWIDYGNKITAT